jgi:two-component system phosphate regulon sensor histidine kinase PhoR
MPLPLGEIVLMRHATNIKRLTIITVIMLAGIVALQFYWLLSSYQQQQKRFYTDIDNALASASNKITLSKALKTQPVSIREMFGIKDSAADNSFRVKEEIIQGKQTGTVVHLVNSVVKVPDSASLKSLRAFLDSAGFTGSKDGQPGRLTFSITDSDLVDYKKAYGEELKSRQITIPFDLAIVDSTDSVCAATCDTAVFNRYSSKSSFIELPAIQQKFGLVAGFHNPDYFVLRNMLWVLVITMTLIVLGSWSLGYLLVIFFRQGRLAEIRNDFMNNMTHELKTPISSVSLAFEMVLDDHLSLSNEKRTFYLLSAQKETTRLKLIVENVLKIMSLEKAELDIIKTEIAARPWMDTIIERITPLLEKKKVAVGMQIEPESLVIHADETHMSNVIYNILENAIKYNDKPAPLLFINISAEEHAVRLCIRDNGQGIPEKYIGRVFEKFFRVPKGNLHDVKGYGLGLSYVKNVIDLHQGTISVHSTAGKETSFVLHLPIKKEQTT